MEATALQRQGELGIWASLLGQEAAQIGSGRALSAQDYAFPTYREHGVAWCRGVDPLFLLGLFRGVDNGGWDPNEFNFHLYTIVIGAQTLHATGYAMGVQRDGAVGSGDPDKDTAVIAYFGDGASSQGDVNEAFVWASVFNAPVVFFCQNNQWAISDREAVPHPALPARRRVRVPRHTGRWQRRAGVLRRHQGGAEPRSRGSGPTLVEAYTYRMGAHTTSDDPTRYRLSSELEAWKLKDPIERVKVYLSRNGHADHTFFDEIDREADELAAHVRQGCLDLPEPDPTRIFDYVHAEKTPELAEQQRGFAAYRASFEAPLEVSAHG